MGVKGVAKGVAAGAAAVPLVGTVGTIFAAQHSYNKIHKWSDAFGEACFHTLIDFFSTGKYSNTMASTMHKKYDGCDMVVDVAGGGADMSLG